MEASLVVIQLTCPPLSHVGIKREWQFLHYPGAHFVFCEPWLITLAQVIEFTASLATFHSAIIANACALYSFLNASCCLLAMCNTNRWCTGQMILWVLFTIYWYKKHLNSLLVINLGARQPLQLHVSFFYESVNLEKLHQENYLYFFCFVIVNCSRIPLLSSCIPCQ